MNCSDIPNDFISTKMPKIQRRSPLSYPKRWELDDHELHLIKLGLDHRIKTLMDRIFIIGSYGNEVSRALRDDLEIELAMSKDLFVKLAGTSWDPDWLAKTHVAIAMR